MRTILFLALLGLGGSPGRIPAVSAPLSAPAAVAARKTVAVLSFDNNTGKPDYDHLGKGMSTLMASDLSSVEEIRLVERDRLADVIKEIDAQQTRYFDSTTAVKVGRLSGAEYIVTGAFLAVDPQMRIDTRVIRVETGEIVKTATVTGQGDRFLDLQKKLARQLVKDLDIALTPEGETRLDQRQQANRIENVEDVTRMSNAIDLSNRGDYANAALRMAPVVKNNPNSVVVRMTYDEISGRAARSSAQKAKTKVNEKIGGLIRKKWPPLER